MKSFFALVLAVALGSASAFAPATRMARTTVSMAAEPVRADGGSGGKGEDDIFQRSFFYPRLLFSLQRISL